MWEDERTREPEGSGCSGWLQGGMATPGWRMGLEPNQIGLRRWNAYSTLLGHKPWGRPTSLESPEYDGHLACLTWRLSCTRVHGEHLPVLRNGERLPASGVIDRG